MTLGVVNLETSCEHARLFAPPSLFAFPGICWASAPFLGLSVLWLARSMREANPLLSYRSWWVGIGILLLCLDLAVIIREILSLLQNAAYPGTIPGEILPFGPLPPLLAIGSFVAAISLLFITLSRGRKGMKGGRVIPPKDSLPSLVR